MASAVRPVRSFVDVIHVSVGGSEEQAGRVSLGNVRMLTLPLGAVPSQLAPFDQLGSPTAADPLHVKFAAEAELTAVVKPHTASTSTTTEALTAWPRTAPPNLLLHMTPCLRSPEPRPSRLRDSTTTFELSDVRSGTSAPLGPCASRAKYQSSRALVGWAW